MDMVARALGRGEQHPPDQTQRRKLDLKWNEECCQRPLKVNASSAHIESESSAHIANESSAHRETASSAHKERSSAHIDAGNQPFRVWLGGWGGWGGVGWDDNVHVPMHTQAQQPHQLSCC